MPTPGIPQVALKGGMGKEVGRGGEWEWRKRE